MPTNAIAKNAGQTSRNRQGRDEYFTPADVTEALLKVEKFPIRIHEPACGREMAIVNVLLSHCYQVTAADIDPVAHAKQIDFMSIGTKDWDAIVTNPPYNLAEQFIRHSLNLGTYKVAMLLRSNFFQAKCRTQSRLSLWQQHPPTRIWALSWRPDFRNCGNSMMEVSWFIWELGFRGSPTYDILPRPEAT